MRRLLLIGAAGYLAYTMLGKRRTLAVAFPDGSIAEFDAVTPELDAALHSGTPVIIDGGQIIHEYTKSQFMGGWLLDGCPLNAVMGFGWQPGQVEALQDAGIDPHCEVIR